MLRFAVMVPPNDRPTDVSLDVFHIGFDEANDRLLVNLVGPHSYEVLTGKPGILGSETTIEVDAEPGGVTAFGGSVGLPLPLHYKGPARVWKLEAFATPHQHPEQPSVALELELLAPSALGQSFGSRVVRALMQRGVRGPCELCEKNDWSVSEEPLGIPLTTYIGGQGRGARASPVIPAAVLVCNNCGNVRIIALNAIGIGVATSVAKVSQGQG